MKKYNNPAKHFLFSIIMTGVIGFFVMSSVSNTNIQTNILNPDTTSVEENQEQKTTPEIRSAVGTYYDGISSSATGTTLLSALRSLNTSKRTRTIGYDNFGDYYHRTDGDPNNSSNIISFYSGKSIAFTGSFSGTVNREHVWPKSRGGNYVEADIHMARPTIASENGSRGNSFYVEGMKSSSGGWDPAMESFGLEKYRGISARIIFYSVVASTQLSLVDLTNDNTSNNTMGKLSDLLSWNLRYGIDATETRRNEAIATSAIQGNRNPFIDHPEYACKIWGSTNSSTQSVCAAYSTPTITLDKSTASVNVGNTTTLVADVTNSSSSVAWSSSATSIATVNSSGVVTGVSTGTAVITASITESSVQYTATCTITVNAAGYVSVTGVSLDKSSSSVQVGNTVSLAATVAPSNATTQTLQWSTSNSSVASISSSTGSSIVVTGVAKGSATITATTTDGGFTAICTISVTNPGATSEWTKVTSSSDLVNGKYIITAPISAGGALYAMTNTNGTGNAPGAVSLTWSGSGSTAVPHEDSYNETTGTNVIWDITKSGSVYIIKPNNASTILYAINDNNGIRVGSTSDTWNLNYVNSYITMQEVNNSRWVEIYNSAEFRSYQSITTGGQLSSNADCFKLQFYRFDESTAGSSTLSSISIASNPSKTSYNTGETLNLSGLVVSATYSDGTSSNITGYTTSPVDGATLSTAGTQTVTVSYKEGETTKTTTFNVTVTTLNVTLTGVSLNITSGNLDIGETLSLTTTVSPNNSYPVPSISWSSSNSNVASISNGLVTAVAAGSATITATATQNAVTKTATCSITVNAAPFVPTTTYSQGGTGTTATLVTDVANLSVGDSVLILNIAGTYALSTTQNTNNRGAVGVSTSGGVLSTIPETAQIMTLEAGTVANTFAFNTGTLGYLYAASSSENYLRSQTTKDANGSWIISIASGGEGEATVTAQGKNTRNLLRYNSSNSPKLFSAYSTGQENVNIYEITAGGYNYNYLLGVLDGDYCTMDLTNLNLIYTRYNAMTSTEIEHFNVSIITGADSNSYTGLEAYSQAMLRRAKLQSEATTNFGLDFQINDQLVSLVIVISVMAFLSITSFFLLKKKNS